MMKFEELSEIPSTHTFAFEAFLASEYSRKKNEGAEDGEQVGGVCRFFLKGFCAKGNACTYRHTTAGGHTHEKSVVCKHWLRGLCKKGDLCEFLYSSQSVETRLMT